MMRRVLALCLITAALPSRASSPDLVRAEAAFGELHFAECLSAAQAALKNTGNDKEAVLRILELEALSAASLGKKAEAQAAFRSLYTLDPDRQTPPDLSPKIEAPLLDARNWARKHGRLAAQVEVQSLKDPSAPRAVTVRLSRDPMGLAKGARVWTRSGTSAFAPHEIAFHAAAPARVGIDASDVDYFVEVLNAHGGVLDSVGSQENPKHAPAVATPPAAAPPAPTVPPAQPPPQPLPPPPPPPVVELSPAPAPAPVTPEPTPAGVVSASAPFPATRLAGVAVGIAGVVSLGVGTAFGLQVAPLRNRVTQAPTDSQGRVTLTQKQAYGYQDAANTDAAVANICFVGGAALIVGGAALALLPQKSPVEVGLAPTPSGVATSLTGHF